MNTISNILKMRILVIIIFLSYINICYSQGLNTDINSNKLNKNVIYATLGVYPGEFYGTLMGNYERMIIEFPTTFISSLWVRVGAGPWVWWTGNGTNYVSTISLLTGRKGVHMETGLGALLTYNPESKNFRHLIRDRYLAGNIGFRFQKPGGKFVFRTGIGWPEFLYLSLGYSF